MASSSGVRPSLATSRLSSKNPEPKALMARCGSWDVQKHPWGEGVANLVRRAGGVATLLAGVGVVFAANASCPSPLPWPLGWPQGNPEETPPALAADGETDAGAA